VREGRTVVGWDPLAIDDARRVLGDRIEYAASAEAAICHADAVVIGNPLKELATIDWSRAGRATIIDCWRCLPASVTARFPNYIGLGRGPGGSVTQWLDHKAGDRLDLLVN
jgi:UDPglucose 6-dehydrogenase